MKVVVIGSGNLADVMAEAIAAGAAELVQVYARNEVRGEEIARRFGCGFTAAPHELAAADLYLIAVSDRAIPEVSKKLNFGSGVVAHMAGGVEVEALSGRIKDRAVLYPVQTFTKGRRVDLTVVPFIAETTTAKSEACLNEFAAALSLSMVAMTGNQRAQVHLAAVLACNFTNHLYVLADKVLKEKGIPFDILKPLIVECAHKAVEAPSPRLVQSGPASRNDVGTISRHRELLSNDPYLQRLYINLSQSIWEISKKI